MLATIDAYSISVFIHVAAVVVGFGSTYALALTFPVAMKVDPRHLPYVHALGAAVGRLMATPALVIVLITGFYQVAESEADYSLGDAWISATLAIVIVLGGLSGAYFAPSDRKLGAKVEQELAAIPPGEEVVLSEEYQAGAKRQGMIGGLAGFLVLVAVFLMVTKPGA
jgi:Predicted integral membrane protein (DUF2269)